MSLADISVVMPTANRHEDAIDAIETLKHLDPPPSAILLVDDGQAVPSNPLENKIRAVSGEGIELIYLATGGGKGANYARNLGLKHASTAWICMLDDDDRLSEDYFAGLSLSDEREIRYADKVFINRHGRQLRKKSFAAKVGLDDILKGNAVGTNSGVIFGRDAVLAEGGYDENLPALQDYELWLRLAISGFGFRKLEQGCVFYQTENPDGSITFGSNNYEKAIKAIGEKYSESPHSRKIQRFLFKARLNRNVKRILNEIL